MTVGVHHCHVRAGCSFNGPWPQCGWNRTDDIMFRDPDILRRLRAIHSDGTVRLCGWCPRSQHMAYLLAEQLAGESIAFLRLVHQRDPISIPRMAMDGGDLVQSTMIKVLEHSEEFEGEAIEEWTRWLHAVWKNTILRRTKSAHKGSRHYVSYAFVRCASFCGSSDTLLTSV